MNEPKDYYFTFTRTSELCDYYVIIHDTYDLARDRMMALFGSRWAFQFPDPLKAEVSKYGLTCLVTLT